MAFATPTSNAQTPWRNQRTVRLAHGWTAGGGTGSHHSIFGPTAIPWAVANHSTAKFHHVRSTRRKLDVRRRIRLAGSEGGRELARESESLVGRERSPEHRLPAGSQKTSGR